MDARRAAAFASLMLCLCPIAPAGVIVNLVDDFGRDSGWSVTLTDAIHTSVLVDEVDADRGVVPAGDVFMPGLDSGRLYIDVNLAAENTDFFLKQYPTPEPGTLVLLALGAGLGLVRYRNRRAWLAR